MCYTVVWGQLAAGARAAKLPREMRMSPVGPVFGAGRAVSGSCTSAHSRGMVGSSRLPCALVGSALYIVSGLLTWNPLNSLGWEAV